MTKIKLTKEEIENLGYYNFLAYMGVPVFALGGLKSTEELAEMCGINENSKVLVVGCGTGSPACHLAKELGCSIVGIDIAENMISKAQERAEKEKLQDLVEFQIGDAYDLNFEDSFFDAIITQFVSQFLNRRRAFKEFVRVLKPGGFVGLNEMYKAAEIPEEAAERITEAEDIFREVTELPFTFYTPDEWRRSLEEASLIDVQIEEHPKRASARELLRSMGVKNLFRVMGKMLKLYSRSKIIRKRFKLLSRAKKIIMRKKATAQYVGYVLCAGKKS